MAGLARTVAASRSIAAANAVAGAILESVNTAIRQQKEIHT